MPKKESHDAQAITQLNCPGYNLGGEDLDPKDERDIAKVTALVVLNRDGTLRILCPVEKEGKCHRSALLRQRHQNIDCPYKSKFENTDKK